MIYSSYNEFENWHLKSGICYLNSKTLFDPKISISIQNIIIEFLDQHFDFKYFYLNLKFEFWVF
jgi:hypothetical protein